MISILDKHAHTHFKCCSNYCGFCSDEDTIPLIQLFPRRFDYLTHMVRFFVEQTIRAAAWT
jgi:hypothetical protein